MRPVHHRLLRQAALLTLAITFVACNDTDNLTRPSVQGLYTTPTGLVTANPPQIFTGAGNISSCSNSGDEATAKLLDGIPEGTVYAIGDNAYPNGTAAEFACYNPTWGRHKARTKPAAGNHEYNTAGAPTTTVLRRRGRRPEQGLLQLQSRRLAHHRAEQQHHALAARPRICGCANDLAATRTSARSPTGTTRCTHRPAVRGRAG